MEIYIEMYCPVYHQDYKAQNGKCRRKVMKTQPSICFVRAARPREPSSHL